MSGDGRTVLEKVDFVWDGTTLCEQTAQSDTFPNPVTLTWDHQGPRPLAQTERISAAGAPQQEIDQRFFSIITDLVGTPTELIDEQGDIAWRTRTTLWGTTTWNSDAKAHTPLRFPGQYHDPETGLHYNFHRYYDPETARYLTPDPLGLAPAPTQLSAAPQADEHRARKNSPSSDDHFFLNSCGSFPESHRSSRYPKRKSMFIRSSCRRKSRIFNLHVESGRP
ncbi:hypothetical protein QR77_10970 [Streptomyces sp. 150FB]|nr:hypothetical protein QR77_10970 [Streptomyces sp. 150FB]